MLGYPAVQEVLMLINPSYLETGIKQTFSYGQPKVLYYQRRRRLAYVSMPS